MIEETDVNEYFSSDKARKSTVSQDKYHYIVRMYEVGCNGNIKLWGTRLVYKQHPEVATGIATDFVAARNGYETIEWPMRISNQHE